MLSPVLGDREMQPGMPESEPSSASESHLPESENQYEAPPIQDEVERIKPSSVLSMSLDSHCLCCRDAFSVKGRYIYLFSLWLHENVIPPRVIPAQPCRNDIIQYFQFIMGSEQV